MIFTSFEFVIFFLVVVGVRACIRNHEADKWFLLGASYVFYMSWSIPCGLLILATSLLDYYVGLGLGRIENPRQRKLLLICSIVANLGVLGFFKYTNFLLDTASSGLGLLGVPAHRWHYDIILPAGISFFTFQSMTYTIETYRRNLRPSHSLRDFLLFVAFFPQLLAGPINRAVDLLPQFARRVRAGLEDVEAGLAQFAVGAVKKCVLSDQIAPSVDLVFAAPGSYDALTLLLAALGYSLQIYCDFSGYSDMAIGCARMMGFRFMENFQMPYSSVNITEFWRRWHISLSSWFRDYLYIPLGGNRRGTGRTYINLLVTMLLCGLWHGASWNFILWGGFHGVCLAVHRLWTRRAGSSDSVGRSWIMNALGNGGSRLLTLSIVVVGWIFFRVPTLPEAWTFLGRIACWTSEGVRVVSPQILGALGVVIITHLVIRKDRNWAHEVPMFSMPKRIAAYAALLTVLTLFSVVDSSPFIYFQF
jgi:alginate O-acetyltransferase complex protein AlgI